jgi:type I site-specific restriction endonuclease
MTVPDALSSGYGELRDEMQERYDDMSSNNMDHLPACEAAEEAASTLDDEADDEPESPKALKVTARQGQNKRKGRGESWAVRLGNACARLRAVIEDQEKVEGDLPVDVQESVGHLQNIIDAVESVEFPGMCG